MFVKWCLLPVPPDIAVLLLLMTMTAALVELLCLPWKQQALHDSNRCVSQPLQTLNLRGLGPLATVQ